MEDGPLTGLRVLDVSTILAGPLCCQILGDQGADVIKIEHPIAGDGMRGHGPSKKGIPLWWKEISRNKRTVGLNLSAPEGADILLRLARTADVLVENFRPGTLERWGLGWDRLSEINPKLIMVRVSGYGQTGPYSQRAGFGVIGEAMGGLRNVTGYPDRPPTRVGISIGDSLAATFGALGALVALHHRDVNGGRGQVVDVGIYEAVLAMMESTIPEYALTGYIRGRTGSTIPGVAPSNIYPTKDGDYVLIAGNADNVFRRLSEAIGHPEWPDDPRFATHQARGEHMEELDGMIADWTRQRSAEEILSTMHEAGVPAGKVYTAKDMMEDPQFAARENIVWVEDPEIGPIPMQNVVPRLSETPGAVRSTGPALGQHNAEIYGELLGISPEEQASLRERGVI